jgi:hypothetical protein
MSLAATGPDPIPAETVRAARAAFPKGSLAIQLRDQLGPLYTDAAFADLFSPLGSAWRAYIVGHRQRPHLITPRRFVLRNRIEVVRHPYLLPLTGTTGVAGHHAIVVVMHTTLLDRNHIV